MGDYCRANFKGCHADFNVGETAKYLNQRYRIVVKHKRSADRCKEEKAIKQQLKSEGKVLLDKHLHYDENKTTPEQQRARVKDFCEDTLLKGKRRMAVPTAG